jgi:hypothetical protein
MDETALGSFGGKRRTALRAKLLSAVQSKRTLCAHRLAEDRNQTIRFNNFLANPAVSTHEMVVTAGRKTNRRAAGRHVLAVMDTIDVLFSTQHDNKRGFGLDRVWLAAVAFRWHAPVSVRARRRAVNRTLTGASKRCAAKLPKRGPSSDGVHPGLFPHPVLAVVAANGGVIGSVDCIVLNRTPLRTFLPAPGAEP